MKKINCVKSIRTSRLAKKGIEPGGVFFSGSIPISGGSVKTESNVSAHARSLLVPRARSFGSPQEQE